MIEAIGLVATSELALGCVRPGGTVTLVGMIAQAERIPIDGYRFVEDGIRLLGSNYGSAVPARDFPRIASDVVSGRLPLGRLVSEHITLEGIDDALAAMRRRDGARRVVMFASKGVPELNDRTAQRPEWDPWSASRRAPSSSGSCSRSRGWRHSSGGASRWVRTTSRAPVWRFIAGGGLVVIWALVVAPKARNPLSPMTRWLIGTVLLMVAAVALWTVGLPELAVLFAVLVAIDTAILLWIDTHR